jgi:low temperature requirement protein LtrA
MEGWNLHAGHFAERHGLFVIIALGETLIVAANGVAETDWSAALIVLAILAVAATCALWWTYFRRAAGQLEAGFAATHGTEKSQLGRDTYSLLHFVMLLGVIGYAAGLEAAVTHPSGPLEPPAALALGLGIGLFVLGMAAALRRATGALEIPRLLIGAATAAVLVLARVDVAASLGIAILGLVVLGVLERE